MGTFPTYKYIKKKKKKNYTYLFAQCSQFPSSSVVKTFIAVNITAARPHPQNWTSYAWRWWQWARHPHRLPGCCGNHLAIDM